MATLALAALARPAAARFTPHLAALAGGGGVTDFAYGEYRARTTPGGAWDLRITIGTRTPLAVELGYVGTVQLVRDPLAPDPALQSNAVEAVARLNLATGRVQPFVTGGAGWINFHSYGHDEAPGVAREFVSDSNGVVVPLGAGVATYLGEHFVLDTRFTYRVVPEKLLAGDDRSVSETRADHWTAMLRGGYAF